MFNTLGRRRCGRRVRTGVIGLLGLGLAACTGGAGSQAAPSAIATTGTHAPTTVTVWTFNHLPNEVAAFEKSFADLKATYPWLTVNFVPNKDDAAFAKAVAAGDAPDVFVSAAPDNVGKFCNDGTVSDMNGFMSSAGMKPEEIFPAATLVYTRFSGKTCALPLLTDVFSLYYNKKMFAEAGITQPPRTLSELSDVARKLTKRAADGSVERFGFVSRSDYNVNGSIFSGVQAGADYYDGNGKSTLSADPRWKKLVEWNLDLNKFYGDKALQKFVGTYNAHTDDAKNPFITGAVAMEFDGEWHIGELAENAPDLDYGIAPFPVLDEAAADYGAGVSAGTVVYLPSKAKHPQEAFFVAQQLTTDSTFLTSLADAVSNVPTTFESLDSWTKAKDEHWASVIDIFKHPKSRYTTITAAGAEAGAPWGTLLQAAEAGKVGDLGAALAEAAKKTDSINADFAQ